MNSPEENLRLCDGCTLCCEHVTIEIDTPKDVEEYEEIIWYVLHENVAVFIDNDGSWNVEFKGRCAALDKSGLCKIHKKRPTICREYDQSDCVKYGEGEPWVHRFENKEQFLEYLEKKKPEIYRKIR